MSRFSGKYDLADWIEIAGGFESFLDSETKIYHNSYEIPYKTELDLVDYYPHIIKYAAGDKIFLMSESWIDYEKRNGWISQSMYDYYKEQLLKYKDSLAQK